MAAGSLRRYFPTLALAVASYPTSNYTPVDARDYDENAGATYDRTDTGTVPASSPYRMFTELKPKRNSGMTVTVGGVSRTIVRLGTQASGQVGVDFNSGMLEFHSSDAGGSASVTYQGVGTLIDATLLNRMQNEIVAVQTSCTGKVTGPGSATDNAIARYDGTTGKLIQNSGASIDDSGNITATNISGSTSGTNTGDVTLNTALNSNLMSIKGQQLGLDTQSANLVFAGPASGSAAVPTFRSLGDDDLGSCNVGFTNTTNQWDEAQTFIDGAFVEKDYDGSGAPTAISDAFQVFLKDVNASATNYSFFSARMNVNSDIDIQTLNFRMQASGSTASANIDWANASGTPVVAATSPLSITASTGTVALSGVVGIANGGTNSTATPTAGAVAYGTGSAFAWTSAGTAGHVLTSSGTGAPAFVPGVTSVYNQAGIWASAGDATVTLSGNERLLSDGDQLRIFYVVTAGGSPDEVSLSLDGQEVWNYTSSGDPQIVEVRLWRTGATTAKFVVVAKQFGSNDQVYYGELTGLSNLGTSSSYNLTLNTVGDDIIRVFTVEKIAAKS